MNDFCLMFVHDLVSEFIKYSMRQWFYISQNINKTGMNFLLMGYYYCGIVSVDYLTIYIYLFTFYAKLAVYSKFLQR